MQSHTSVRGLHEFFDQPVGSFLSLHEGQHAPPLLVETKQLQQLEELLIGLNHDHRLFHVLADNAPPTNLYFYRLIEDLTGKRLHLTWERSREHHRLPVGSGISDNLHNLRFESHIKHTVSLIKYQIRESSQVSDTPTVSGQDVDHSSGGAHHDLRPSLEVRYLFAHPRASVHTHCTELQRLAKLPTLIVYLDGEFPRGGEY